MELGIRTEPLITDLYEEKTGHAVERLFTRGIRHELRPYHIGHPDGIRDDGVLFEAKNVGAHRAHLFGDSETDQVPDDYLAQVAWYCALVDAPRAHLAALIGGNRFRVYHIERDPKLEEILVGLAEKFWSNHVQADRAPQILDSRMARSYLKSRYPKELGPVRGATAEEEALVEKFLSLKAEAKKLEDKLCDVEIQVKATIAEAAGLDGPQFRITYRASSSQGVDWKGLAESFHPTTEQTEKWKRPGVRRLLATRLDKIQ